MKKYLLLNIIMLCMALCAKADHIAGGEISYTFKSKNGNQFTYSVTVKMYMNCFSTREFPSTVIVSFFERTYNSRVLDVPVLLSNIEILRRTDTDPCINNPPEVCFKIGYYCFEVTLPASSSGYLIAAEVFYRVDNLKNLAPGYHTGATYTAEIPGTWVMTTAPANNSALFFINDLQIICENSYFTYKFGASDADGDTLRYYLCEANAANAPTNNEVRPPQDPPYEALPYAQNYSGSQPLGGGVHIDGNTGLISGIAPSAGNYAIAICVEEVRNGRVIATQRKDLQVSVAACSRASASLLNKYTVCNAVPSIRLQNESTSPLIISYYWQINNMQGNTVFSSSEPVPTYTFTVPY